MDLFKVQHTETLRMLYRLRAEIERLELARMDQDAGLRWTEIDPEDSRTWPPLDQAFITDVNHFGTSFADYGNPGCRRWLVNHSESKRPLFRAWFPAPPPYVLPNPSK